MRRRVGRAGPAGRAAARGVEPAALSGRRAAGAQVQPTRPVDGRPRCPRHPYLTTGGRLRQRPTRSGTSSRAAQRGRAAALADEPCFAAALAAVRSSTSSAAEVSGPNDSKRHRQVLAASAPAMVTSGCADPGTLAQPGTQARESALSPRRGAIQWPADDPRLHRSRVRTPSPSVTGAGRPARAGRLDFFASRAEACQVLTLASTPFPAPRARRARGGTDASAPYRLTTTRRDPYSFLHVPLPADGDYYFAVTPRVAAHQPFDSASAPGHDEGRSPAAPRRPTTSTSSSRPRTHDVLSASVPGAPHPGGLDPTAARSSSRSRTARSATAGERPRVLGGCNAVWSPYRRRGRHRSWWRAAARYEARLRICARPSWAPRA